ncbi:hypothetical protein GALMADRAFT_148481 [Galerina marginata CBS 339.88]|uniref:Uncharacterized protein n=1 Tax=Galerina marginata (strain CBS 339.88) TaxID=685588 RepID=A0A067S4I5_GALM3|nr:hypothetical protein GALMADRAFT_148481 [Galerina marginata CBS 339.88]
MAKSQTKKQATHAETPYRRRSARIHKASTATNQVDMANNSGVPIIEANNSGVPIIEANNTVIEDTNMSEELEYPLEEHARELHLERFISSNLPLGKFNCDALKLLWKGTVQSIVNQSMKNEESRRHAICVVRQAAACLDINLGATIPIPVGEDRATRRPNIFEVNSSIPHLSDELKHASKTLWDRWGNSKNLVDLVALAEEEILQADVQAFILILAKSVGILSGNIINQVTYAVQHSKTFFLPAAIQNKILDNLSAYDRQSFAETSKSHLFCLNRYNCNLIGSMLEDFGFTLDIFMSALADCQAIITGSFALQPLLPKDQCFNSNNLDIVMSTHAVRLFQTKILHGYTLYIPDTRFHSYNPVICDRIIFSHKDARHTIRILIIKNGHSPLESIFYEPTTAMMNAITPKGLFSAYPALLHFRISLNNPWMAFDQNRNNPYLGRHEAEEISTNMQRKYANRGFITTCDLHNIEMGGNTMALEHRCRIDPVCPLTPRVIGDRGCILWPFLKCQIVPAAGDIGYVMPGINFNHIRPQLDNIYWTVGAGVCGAPQAARPSGFIFAAADD